jgi:hypothetical protein
MRMAPEYPRRDSLKNALLEELGVSEAIVRDGHEVIPRFRIVAPREQFVILLRLPEDTAERPHCIHLVGLFMAWKMATAFIISCELRDPHSISSFAVARDERNGIMRRIDRGPPLSFAPIAALAEGGIERELTALLPRKQTTMTREMVAELEFVFGKDGEMPAMRVR